MAKELTKAEYEYLRQNIHDKSFRMSNLYYILDTKGVPVLYNHNPNQQKIFASRWYNMIVLKSRRQGATTGWAMDTFDFTFWTHNMRVGIISELNSSAAKIVEKMKFAHSRLPTQFQEENPITTDNKYELAFKNGSSIYSETSFRGDTIQRMLISEFGPICAERPDKAKRIVAGALSTVSTGQEVIVESTAKGPGGYFHEWCIEAFERQKKGIVPTKMDFFLVFIPWWKDPSCVLPTDGVIINQRMQEYFAKLEGEIKVSLTNEQKAFYLGKAKMLGPDVFAEYPATIAEAFSQNDEGKYYRLEMIDLYNEKRVGKVPYERGYPVTVSADIGINHTVLWFSQTCGAEEHIIDHFDASGAYADDLHAVCMERQRTLGYQYDYFVWPHDIKVRNQFSKDATRFATVQKLFGADKCVICPELPLKDGIQTTRQYLSRVYIDAEKCDEGIKGLQNYTMEWSEHLQRYLEGSPRKDVHSDHADSFRYTAIFKTVRRGKGLAGRPTGPGGAIQIHSTIPTDAKKRWKAMVG